MGSIDGASGQRVLVIDDNHDIHADSQKILSGQPASDKALTEVDAVLFEEVNSSPQSIGFEVDRANPAPEGVERVQPAQADGQSYALALVDIRRPPGWNGIESTARLWEVDPELQVLICTAYTDDSWEEVIAHLGQSDRLVILKKPFDNIEVRQLAHVLTEKWRLFQETKQQLNRLEQRVEERTQELTTANDQLQAEIARRTLSEATLRSTQSRLKHLLAQSPVAIYSLKYSNYELTPAWVSDNIANLTGYQAEEWMQAQWHSERVHADDRAAFAANLKRLYADGCSSAEYRIHHRSGGVRWVRDDRKLLRDEKGRPTEVVGAWTDISARKLLEEQLRQSQKMDAIGQLAGGIAHDFNNLLTVIQGHAQLLDCHPSLAVNLKEGVNQITRAAERAAALTRQLLTFSRKEASQAKDVQLNELTGHLSQMLRRLLGEDLNLVIQAGSEVPKIYADPAMIEQVIINLAVNARDAMPKGGSVTISTSREELSDPAALGAAESLPGTYVCLAVSDTGCGIPPQNLVRLFEPFFTTKEVGKGTGLGLAIAHSIVKQHQGWIQVSSEVEKGTTFRVYLPPSRQTREIPAPISLSKPIRGGHERILLVEDEPTLRALARKILSSYGYRVLEASSGREAIDVWQQNARRIDLLLTDVVMPDGMSGLELAEQLKAETPELMVLLTSGYNLQASDLAPDHQSETAFLSKPYHPQTLAQTVRDCLDGKSLNAFDPTADSVDFECAA